MKYSILGFNQSKIINYKKTITVQRENKEKSTKDNKVMIEVEKTLELDLQDLMILNYIIYANSSPKMKHICEDEKSYVWLQHKHIVEDLPILKLTQASLGNRLGKLKSMELIDSKTIANNKNQGSMTYYTITELCENLIYDKDGDIKTTTFKNDVVEEPLHLKMLSNTSTNLHTKVDKEYNTKVLYSSKNSNSSSFEFGYNKPKSNIPKSLSYLTTMIQDNDLRSLLVEYYRKRQKEPSTRISADDYKHCVTDLLNIDTDIEHLKEIVTRTIDGNEHRVYRKWVDPRQKSTNYNSFSKTDLNQGANIHSTQYTEEELKELEEIDKERERKGLRTKF